MTIALIRVLGRSKLPPKLQRHALTAGDLSSGQVWLFRAHSVRGIKPLKVTSSSCTPLAGTVAGVSVGDQEATAFNCLFASRVIDICRRPQALLPVLTWQHSVQPGTTIIQQLRLDIDAAGCRALASWSSSGGSTCGRRPRAAASSSRGCRRTTAASAGARPPGSTPACPPPASRQVRSRFQGFSFEGVGMTAPSAGAPPPGSTPTLSRPA